MSVKLTDTQLIVLSAAAQREDRCLQKFAERLLAAGLVKEIRTKQGAPAWRRDAATAQSYSLKLTAAGLKAIAVEADGAEEAAAEPLPSAPRDGSKSARVVGLLRRDHGATLAELVAATAWLPHTARAALTGLRKRGYAVILERSNKDAESIYRIAIGARLEGDGQHMASENDSPRSIAPPAAAPSTAPADHSAKAERLAKPKGAARSATRKAA